MKQIIKYAEPGEFTNWKRKDNMRKQPRWNRVPGSIKNYVRVSLLNEQGFICCYCESHVTMENSHVEHFRPKGRYEKLQLDYENLHCSCQENLKKREPRQCGYKKQNWFNKSPISPLAAECEARFAFTGGGEILPRRKNDEGAEITIEKLGLNIAKLIVLRAAAIDALNDLSPEQIEILLRRDKEGRYMEFHSTVKHVLLAKI